ncbi:MAG: PPC domain-containing protein [Gammaproteobacteria bacterium]|nr:PPC domain-containing protein [Gammaproteobacteria bacterium]
MIVMKKGGSQLSNSEDKTFRFSIVNFVARAKKKITRSISVILLMVGFSFSSNHSEAIELPCTDCCSVGMMNMMSDAGLMAYSMADMMSNMCQSMPFFGMFCPDIDQMAGSFFSGVLEDPDLTLDLLQCADGNPSLLEWMLHIMDENPELLSQMGFYMGETGDGTSKGCQLGEQFTDMALQHNTLKNFFFEKINNDLYDNLGRNMLCKTQTTKNVGQLISKNATDVMTPNSPFSQVFMNIGTPESDTDGNEVANERVFYSVFGDIDAATDFLNAMEKLEPQMSQAFMDFIFLGKMTIPGTTCPSWDYSCEEQAATEIEHNNQAYHNLYAIMDGFVNGVAPHYIMDSEHPPVPDSNEPANALFGRFMGMMIDPQGNMTPYADRFFSAMASSAMLYSWESGSQFMQLMGGLMTLGQVPFTSEMFEQMMPLLINSDAPAPRNIKDDTECSGDITACYTQRDCNNVNAYWYDNACNATQRPQEAVLNGILFPHQTKNFGPFDVETGSFVTTLTGSGDMDLYVARDKMAFQSSYDCKSTEINTPDENCVLSGSGDYWVMIVNNTNSNTSYELLVVNDPSGTTSGSEDDSSTDSNSSEMTTKNFSGSLRRGQRKYLGPFNASSGEFIANMTGQGDVDLYINEGATAEYSRFDCRPYRFGSDESCKLAAPGEFYILLVGEDYQSSYELNLIYKM